MKSLSNICCEKLNPIFAEIADLSIRRDCEREYSGKWVEYDIKLKTLYSQAKKIFEDYNPEYKGDKKGQKGESL